MAILGSVGDDLSDLELVDSVFPELERVLGGVKLEEGAREASDLLF